MRFTVEEISQERRRQASTGRARRKFLSALIPKEGHIYIYIYCVTRVENFFLNVIGQP